MAEDKYAPKAGDTTKEVHAKHMWLINDFKAANKKERDAMRKKPVPADTKSREGKDSPPTQPPASERPQNPSAPQHQPPHQEETQTTDLQ